MPIRVLLLLLFCAASCSQKPSANDTGVEHLRALFDSSTHEIRIFRDGGDSAIVVQHARPDFRPYLHPIVAPGGKGVLTEFSPGHHKHQTGLYWGFTRVNGRDYFHHPEGDYWRRVSASVLRDTGTTVQWQTVYELLDEKDVAILRETQEWSMQFAEGKYLLDLSWKGDALADVVIGQYDYGGLFLRMPWRKGIRGGVVNSARERNGRAEGRPSVWIDVGMQVEGRDEMAHIAIFDHPDNRGYPQHWRVDNQLGVGPVPTRKGDRALAKGDQEVIQHRLVAYTGDLSDNQIMGLWGEYTGQGIAYAMWSVAQREGLEAKFLTPEEAVANMTVAEGYKVNVWASEPMMTQPMAFCWDDRGRLWIAENRDYESRGHGFSNAGDSRILILEDTDRDGVADSRKVFIEGLAFPAALAVGFDGVFVGAPPNLLFIPDRDRDDKADVDDIEVRLTGWGIQDRHETLNSLHWGPDGWLYGLQGFATPSRVRKPDSTARIYGHKDAFPDDIFSKEGVDINGGVWRYHPVKDRFEVVAHGFSNPWGIDYDAHGQLFISACVIPHLWHVVPGGIYHRQGGRHFNPYVYSDIRTITDHSHRSAHGGARVYLSDAFPASQHGRIFMANIHEHAVLSDVLERSGSGFVGRHGEDFVLANNAQWVGFSMELGPDGGLYVLDWHDADICGREVLNAETGRVFRIMPGQSQAKEWEGRYADLRQLSDVALAELQTSASEWHARRARLILQHRATRQGLKPEAYHRLRDIFENHALVPYRLRALWTLHVTAGLGHRELTQALDDNEEYIRAWAIQLLCEDAPPSAEDVRKLIRMGERDDSPVVRLYLASALQRMRHEDAWALGEALLAREEDAADHNIPKMLWFGLEPRVGQNPARGLALAADARIPLYAEYAARRAADANALEVLVEAINERPRNVAFMLKGMRDGLEGRNDIAAPALWNDTYRRLQRGNTAVVQYAREIAQLFGDTETMRADLNTARNQQASPESRRRAIIALSSRQRSVLTTELPALLTDTAVRIEAIRAIAHYDDARLGEAVMALYPQLKETEKREAVMALASRPVYGRMLTQALRDGTIPRTDVPVYVARQLRRVVGSGFVETWGPIDELPPEQNADYRRYQQLLKTETVAKGDVAGGKKLFQRTCGSCHQMYGEGGVVGPDLTGSNRTNLAYILGNVLNPGEEIQEDYKLVVITTRDGRTYSGNVVGENDRQITMRIVGRDSVVINKSDIQSHETTDESMMPPGLFNALTDKEVVDLVAYLRFAGP